MFLVMVEVNKYDVNFGIPVYVHAAVLSSCHHLAKIRQTEIFLPNGYGN